MGTVPVSTLDLMTTLAVTIMASYSILSGETAVLDATVIVALIGFLGTVAFGRYVEKGGIKFTEIIVVRSPSAPCSLFWRGSVFCACQTYSPECRLPPRRPRLD